MQALPAARFFAHGAAINTLEPLGQGLINDTFKVIAGEDVFVLQRLNHHVFPEPVRIIDNWRCFSRYLPPKPALQLPELRAGIQGAWLYHTPQGEVWRAMNYIDAGQTLTTIQHAEHASALGRALAHFHRLLADVPVERLKPTLANFHQTPVYVAAYEALAATVPAASTDWRVAFCHDCIARKKTFAKTLENARNSGVLATKIMHGDPKVDNFLFDRHSVKVIAMVDLDTVGPGLWHYDIGDCLRSLAGQDDGDFNIALAQAFLTGYQAINALTDTEQALVPVAAELIPFELGVRFFTDYLAGNRYFKITYPEQNLDRAVQQLNISDAVPRHGAALGQRTRD
ncbi:MAG: phosphotransferase [Methylococcales bacterium]|nr:phosphotransferase [Methylococcales bacterium]